MAKGIIYIMETVVQGIIKIGKTRTDQFENRMKNLENNGYSNVSGLKRKFAIEVDEYDDKERLIHDIFSKSRVGTSELFATDMETAVSLLSSLEGKQVYPTTRTKKEIFEEATEELKSREGLELLPDGEYRLNRKIKGFGEVNGRAMVKRGAFTLLKGSLCADVTTDVIPTIYDKAVIEDHILQVDLVCSSPSAAGFVVIGKANNGWVEWKDANGNKINIYRKK